MFSSVTALATLVAAGFGGLTPETGGPNGGSGAPPMLKAAAALALGRLLDLYSTQPLNPKPLIICNPLYPFSSLWL